MIYDLQKASVLKRISAWLLDAILLVMLVTGVASLVSGIVKYDSYADKLQAGYDHYEKEFQTDFDVSYEEYSAWPKEKQERYDAAYEAMIADEEVMYAYNMSITLAFLVVAVSILICFLLLEFLVPLLLGNGQTVGKKVFGLAVMRTGGYRINGISLFIRAILGKYTIETMIPVFIVLMWMFNLTGMSGTVIIVGILAVQLFFMIKTNTNSAIHDKMADTVAVDLNSQMIFESPEAAQEYKARIAAENVTRDPYK